MLQLGLSDVNWYATLPFDRFACISWKLFQQDIIATDFIDDRGPLVVQVQILFSQTKKLLFAQKVFDNSGKCGESYAGEFE